MNNFKSKNNLDFESTSQPTHWDFYGFKVGTCHGLWRTSNKSYEILAIVNEKPNNGHLDDVFEWFENSAKRDNYNILVLELWNERFMDHLINKKGFTKIDNSNIIKKFGD